ncbi:hypothetical protein V5O48_006315 [Marasmius crinis-equi]|uniref:Glutathione S-transferase n=1 Tax=Marasmius crinis-equi TaxID=585013 RepID=A0ABR3FJV9_9AGAR
MAESPNPPVVLYRYDASLFSWKVDHVLLLKNIPHKTVNVSPILPRPEITDALGVIYRRIPIMAIGNDIYCDTRKNGGSSDTGLIKAFTKHFADDVVFPNMVYLIPFEELDPKFVEDRLKALIEEQVSDGREWLFDTETPSLADVAVQFLLEYCQLPHFDKTLKGIFNQEKFPKTLQWLARINGYLKNLKEERSLSEPLDGDTAGKMLASAQFEPYDVVGFDEELASWLGLKLGQTVSVASNKLYNGKDS